MAAGVNERLTRLMNYFFIMYATIVLQIPIVTPGEA